MERTLSQYKRIDILVNLAGGLTRYKPAVEHSLDDWNHELNNNLLSAFLTSRAVFPHMRKAGGGAIINFARAGAGLSQASMVAYNCAKAPGSRLSRARWSWKEEIRDPRQCSGAWAGRYRIEHCRDEIQRFEALDQT
jgi:NAD(P)-dependent dehydrogenase (short-subunit alcohol dehydrogenase family)